MVLRSVVELADKTLAVTSIQFGIGDRRKRNCPAAPFCERKKPLDVVMACLEGFVRPRLNLLEKAATIVRCYALMKMQ